MNSMGAFYSGTDEADDRNKTYYTGVIGKLNLPQYEYKLRFNYNLLKKECKLDEIFDIPVETIEIPKEWMERVKTATYTPSSNVSGGKNKFQRSGSTIQEDKYKGLSFGYGGDKIDDALNWYDEVYGNMGAGSNGLPTYMDQFKEEPEGDVKVNEVTGGVEFVPPKEHNDHAVMVADKNQANNDYMDFLIAQYGEDVACAYDQAMSGISDIEPEACDEVLKAVIKEAYDKLTPSCKLSLSLNA